ncbi:unnamed protein product [Didymodactylos carnosus]|uniref:Uncharacterized protein n=1 Tax=Didymodactylos carnosus TaxID=1234261 RepID=A0A815XKB4_9BILA|nr:unnamed protein product [Didymodactylos carnosus]CAF4420351.1 unnamed protein product [Didymodactylos carnosus]
MLRPLVMKDKRTFTNDRLDFLAIITTNFSSAAVVALKSSLIVVLDSTLQLTDDQILRLADSAAREFNCWFGIGTLPEAARIQPSFLASQANKEFSLKLPNLTPSGHILIDLEDSSCLIELKKEPAIKLKLQDDEKSHHQQYQHYPIPPSMVANTQMNSNQQNHSISSCFVPPPQHQILASNSCQGQHPFSSNIPYTMSNNQIYGQSLQFINNQQSWSGQNPQEVSQQRSLPGESLACPQVTTSPSRNMDYYDGFIEVNHKKKKTKMVHNENLQNHIVNGISQQARRFAETRYPFPPFIIRFSQDVTESIIISDLKNHFRNQHDVTIALIGHRLKERRDLLLFVENRESFLLLLDENNWPITISTLKYGKHFPKYLPP